MATVRLTMSQALTRWMTAQSIEQLDGSIEPAFAGVWAIFGHGNVAGLGEALYGVRDQLPTYRGHNEQSMAHIAIAYACLLYTSPSPRDREKSRMPSSA